MLGVAYSPDGTHVATCSSDHSVKIWDIGARACVQSFPEAHTDQVWSIAFDPTGQGGRLCSVGDDKAIRLYEVNVAA